MVASLSTVVRSKDSQFTWVDCHSPEASSPSPSPSSSSSSANSTFWSNVDALLDALPAFVRGLCRGDTTPARCATYLRDAARSIRSRCNDSSRRAAIWYDDGSGVTIPAPMYCFVSYADTNASTAYEDAFRQPFQNAVVVSDKDGFERSYNARRQRLRRHGVAGAGADGRDGGGRV
ncbi:uncharacterized protein LOC120677994 [Panicum virgatum]|uniref:uncharacterized protein LOC120677994 n=1 Tax=Panicum virgatum TaxID=38727 RepID=UPI0019D57675|nr:uncharacterized protein LOC120677994 [Panicum virgatum]